MQNKLRIVKEVVVKKKPEKAKISDQEFRRKLKNIKEWRKERLAEIRTENHS